MEQWKRQGGAREIGADRPGLFRERIVDGTGAGVALVYGQPSASFEWRARVIEAAPVLEGLTDDLAGYLASIRADELDGSEPGALALIERAQATLASIHAARPAELPPPAEHPAVAALREIVAYVEGWSDGPLQPTGPGMAELQEVGDIAEAALARIGAAGK